MAQIPRLHIDQDLGAGQSLPLSREAAHYLFAVMRLAPGAPVELFNGRDGAWRAEVAQVGKRGGVLRCLDQISLQQAPLGVPRDLWLLFAPVKKAQTDFIVEKAVEMGVARLCPVTTDFTNSDRIRPDKMQARVIEAAEQCGISYVPEVAPLGRLSAVLDHWSAPRRILFCDEGARGAPVAALETSRDAGAQAPWAVLIGPEGGFSERERNRLHRFELAHATSLGPRILRAETAVVAALTLWQTHAGDWQ